MSRVVLKVRHPRAGAVFLAFTLAILFALPVSASALVVHGRSGQFFGVAPHEGIPAALVPGSVAAAHAAGGATARAASRAAAQATASTYWQNLSYQGGPVLHSSDPYVIFWGPSGDSVPADWQTLIERYFDDVAADNGSSTNVYSVARQFTDAAGFADYRQSFDPGSQVIEDTSPYPAHDSANCAASQSTTCVTDAQLQAEISSVIAAHGLPTDGPTTNAELPNGAPIYFVVLPSDVDICLSDGSGTCASNDFCAYHSAYVDGSDNVLYATIPTLALGSTQAAKSCQWDGNSAVQEPNASLGDVALKYLSHEDNETITDPLGNGWWNAYTGNENGDNCNDYATNANAFTPTLGGSAGAGTLYNQLIGGHQYYLQSEWSNGDSGCEMKASSATIPPRFSVPSGPRSPGSALSFSPTTSSGAAAYSSETWNFGDGTTSFHAGRRLTSASHTYAGPGDYTVTLTLVDNRGNVASTSEQISVGASPIAAFAASPAQLQEGSGPVTVDATTSTDSGGSITSYAWDFGDGTTAQGATASHTYQTAGTYLVRLTVTDSLGQVDTATSTATVTDETPSAAFTIAVRNPESGQAIAFDGSPSRDPDGSISSYAWSFGDGSRAWGPAPTHTYSSPGTYSVTLTVTDSSGQRSSVTQQLTVSRGPTATFTVSAAQLVEGTSVSFDGTASATGGLGAALQSYAWSFGDGATATGPSATHTYTTPGNHTVTLTVSDTAGGRSTASRTIFVADEPPTAAFGTPTGIVVPDQTLTLDAGASTDPDGAIGSYTWSFGDRGTATGRSATHAYANPGTYTVQLTVRDSDGQSATATHTLTVHTQPASNFAFSPALPREGAATTFDGRGSLSSDPGTAIISYLWSFGDGASASGATATHTYARAGAYPVTLSVTNNLGLTDVSTEQVTVAHGLPTAVISDRPAQPVRGRPVRFTGSSSHAADETFLSYTWRFGDGSSAAGRAPTHTYARAGHFVVSLTVTDSFGDSTTTTSPVTVTRHGLITDVAVRSSRAGATVLVSVNDAGTLTAAHRKLSLNRPGTAAIPVRLSRTQIRALRAKHQVDLRLARAVRPARRRAEDNKCGRIAPTRASDERARRRHPDPLSRRLAERQLLTLLILRAMQEPLEPARRRAA